MLRRLQAGDRFLFEHSAFLHLLREPGSSPDLATSSPLSRTPGFLSSPTWPVRTSPQRRLGFNSLVPLSWRSHGLPRNLSTWTHCVPNPPPPDLTGRPFLSPISGSLLVTATWTPHGRCEPSSASSSPKPRPPCGVDGLC